MLVFQDLEGVTEVFGGTSAGMSGPKLPLWAEFSFLKEQIRADFRAGDEDSNFSVFRVRRFSEWPEPLH